MHNAAAGKSTPVFNTQPRLISHLSSLPAWQYTLNVTQHSMNHQTVSSLHQRARTPPHRFLKCNIKYRLNHKITHCSTYTTPHLPPTLTARLAYVKPSIPTNIAHSKPPNQLPTYNVASFLITTHTQKPAGSSHTRYTILPPFSLPPSPAKSTSLQLPDTIQCICVSSCIYPHQLCGNIR